MTLRTLVNHLMSMVDRVIGEDIVTHREVGPHLALVYMDGGQLETALLNLALNARDAMPCPMAEH